MEQDMAKFAITQAKGFQITFSNGNTISVQFGYGNYCTNRDYSKKFGDERKKDMFCTNAEIAILNASGNWITKEAAQEITGDDICDDVIGWQHPNDVAKYIAWACK